MDKPAGKRERSDMTLERGLEACNVYPTNTKKARKRGQLVVGDPKETGNSSPRARRVVSSGMVGVTSRLSIGAQLSLQRYEWGHLL